MPVIIDEVFAPRRRWWHRRRRETTVTTTLFDRQTERRTCPTCGQPVGLSDPGELATVTGSQETSRLASFAALPRSGTQRRTVLAFIAQQRTRGCTDEEAQEALAMTGNTYRPRRGELARGGWIVRAGRRLTRDGNDADVWVLSEAGRERLAL